MTLRGADEPAYGTTPPFVRSVPIEKALASSTLLALRMNREPLPLLHGGPARLVLPGWYGENWIKWLSKITLTRDEDPGFYMHKGYRMPAKPVTAGSAWDSATGVPIHGMAVQSLITTPKDGEDRKQGPFDIKGKAFSGEDQTGHVAAIQSVVYSQDEGKTWLPTELSPQKSSGGWQEFHATVVPTKEGPLTLMVRAKDTAGAEQPVEHTWNPGGYVRNAVHKITVSVGAQDEETSEAVIRGECYRCHDRQMLASQNLSTDQWLNVFKKMTNFGAHVSNPEKLAKFLAEHQHDLPKILNYDRIASEVKNASTISLGKSTKTSSKISGQKIFTDRCAVCHGVDGRGQIGPRLIGRTLPQFGSTVMYGRNKMPAFAGILTESEIEAIGRWALEKR